MVELVVARGRAEDGREQVDRVIDRLRRQPHRPAVRMAQRDAGLGRGLDPAHLVDLALLELVDHAVGEIGQAVPVQRRQQMAAKQVLVMLERLGLDLAGAHVEPAACPDVEGRVSLLERQLLGRLAVDPGLDFGDHAPALGFGEDRRPAVAGEPESPRHTPAVDHDPEPETRIRAVLERPDVDRSLDGAPGACGRISSSSRHRADLELRDGVIARWRVMRACAPSLDPMEVGPVRPKV
jgi:hypothetical protein